MIRLIAAPAALIACVGTGLGAFSIDFETEDDGVTPLVNGQEINAGDEFGNIVSITSPTNALSIFDSSDGGPNAASNDEDLLVNRGNILILQQSNRSAQSVPDIFDDPDDDAGGGTIDYDFTVSPDGFITPIDITLVDINGNNQDVLITLTDIGGNVRVFDVPSMWTTDVSADNGLDGFDVLVFNDTNAQPGEGGAVATVTQDDLGFDITRVTNISFEFEGSGGLDTLNFVPTPGAAGLFAVAGFAAIRRRR